MTHPKKKLLNFIKMKNKFKLAVEQYQCPGCVAGCDTTCFSEHETGIGCGKHCAGTIIFPGIGNVFLEDLIDSVNL